MLGYDKIDISEGIDMNKTNTSEECDICYYFYFLHKMLSMINIFAMTVMI